MSIKYNLYSTIIEINMFPNMNIISTTYYRVTTFIHIYPQIFVLFHENITIITIDACTCSIASIYKIIISFMSSTLCYARPLNP